MADESTPNLRIPMIPSINGEPLSGDVFNVTASQVIVNMIHDIAKNDLGGNTTAYLNRRPGWSTAQTSYGTSTQVPYAVFRRPLDGAATWMAVKDTGGAQVVTDGSTNTTVFTDSNYIPSFVTVANLSGTPKAVVQFRKDFSTAHRVFYGSAIGSWTEITDAVFAALVHRGKIEFIDGHLIALASDRNLYNCKLNDPTTWPAGNLIPKSIKLDVPSGLILHKNIVLAFGTDSCEGFVTDGSNNPSGTILRRVKDLTEDIGLNEICGNGNDAISLGLGSYYAQLGGMTFFLGNERQGVGSAALYAFNGARFEKISGDFTSKIFSDDTVVYGIHPFCFYGRRCIAFQITAPSASGTQQWWLFDIDWKQWYLWTSSEFMPINDGNVFAGASASRDETFAVGTAFADGLAATHVYDAYPQFDIPNEKNEELKMAWYGFSGETSPSTNNVTVSFSDNDVYGTFTSRGTINAASRNKRLYRGGAFQRRTVRLVHATNKPWRVQEFQARVVK